MNRTTMTPIRPLALLCSALIICGSTIADEPSATAQGPEPANLLTNGDFERLGKRDMPERWITKQHAGQRAYEIVADKTLSHDGHNSLRIHRYRAQVWGLAEQIIPAFHLPGKSVRFRLWVRTENVGPEGASVYLGAYNGSLMLQESRTAPIAGNGDWTPHELTLLVPPETTQLQVGLSLHDAGTAWIDGAELVVADAAAEAPAASK